MNALKIYFGLFLIMFYAHSIDAQTGTVRVNWPGHSNDTVFVYHDGNDFPHSVDIDTIVLDDSGVGELSWKVSYPQSFRLEHASMGSQYNYIEPEDDITIIEIEKNNSFTYQIQGSMKSALFAKYDRQCAIINRPWIKSNTNLAEEDFISLTDSVYLSILDCINNDFWTDELKSFLQEDALLRLLEARLVYLEINTEADAEKMLAFADTLKFNTQRSPDQYTFYYYMLVRHHVCQKMEIQDFNGLKTVDLRKAILSNTDLPSGLVDALLIEEIGSNKRWMEGDFNTAYATWIEQGFQFVFRDELDGYLKQWKELHGNDE